MSHRCLWLGQTPILGNIVSDDLIFHSGWFTDMKGFVAIDHQLKEIVVSLRGTASTANRIIDILFMLSPWEEKDCKGCAVHSGFAIAEASIRHDVGKAVRKLLHEYPDHKITVCTYEFCSDTVSPCFPCPWGVVQASTEGPATTSSI